MVTMQDIAEKAGVNKSTVSHVLNKKHVKARIGPKTCARIKSIADELGYRCNELARSVATGKSNVIAFVSCNTGSWEYTAKIMAGILEEITKQNYSLKVYHLSGKNSLNIAEQIIQQRADGVIFHSPKNTDFQTIQEEMKKNHIPCATANLTSKNACIGVTTDDFQGIKDAVKHLAELGHRRILYLSHRYLGIDTEYMTHRRDGYLAGMKEYIGKHVIPRNEFLSQIASEDKAVIKRILSEPVEQRPTAIVCINDNTAMEVLQMAYQIGIKIPEELSIIGFADLDMAKYAVVPLTTIAQPFEEMGRETANMLLAIVDNKTDDFSQRVDNRKLKVKLVVRQSTMEPKKNKN